MKLAGEVRILLYLREQTGKANLSRTTLYRWLRREQHALPVRHVGGGIYVDSTTVDAWLDEEDKRARIPWRGMALDGTG